jgi:glycosyltransferase involved in cell wall biosynthesis
MRIVLLNQAFYPDVASSAQHAADLAARLAESGHEVTVIASRRAYDSPSRLFAARERWRGVEILRVGSTAFGKSALWRRAVDFASFLLMCAGRLLMTRRADVTIAMTSPPLVAVLAALFVKLKGGALVSWVMDLNPDEAIAAGALRVDSRAARWLNRLLRFSLSASAAVVVMDRFMRDRVVRKGVPPSRVAILPPWPHSDVVRYDAAGRDRFRAGHGLAGKFVVMYSGNHSPCHPLDTVLAAAVEMRAESQVAFLFVGGGSEFRKVEEFAKRHELHNILCLPYQPLAALAGSLSAADLHVVAMGDPFVGIVHPCKIYNILAVGSDCLYVGPRPSHISELAESLDAGRIRCAQHGAVGEVVNHVRQASANEARRAAVHFDTGGQIAHMIDVVETAGQGAGRRIPVEAILTR